MIRTALCRCILGICLSLAIMGAEAQSEMHQITDILGRTVTVPKTIHGIILGESRFIPALAIVDEQAGIPRIKGMLADLQQYDPSTWQVYAQAFPALEKIPLIGKGSAESFSVERAISLGPDVALFGISGHGPSQNSKQMLSQLESAGIPVIFIDFREKPLQNTSKSVRILGQLFGREQRAESFSQFYETQLKSIQERVAQIPSADRPTVFLHSKVGLFAECCETMGDTMVGSLLVAAGGRHMGAELIPGHVGNVNIEYLLSHQPDKYLATAIGSGKLAKGASAFVQLGPDVNAELARASLRQAAQGMMVRNLEAVKQEQMFAVWHHFYSSPFNLAALAAIAKWLHPDHFHELNPEAMLAELYGQYQPVPFRGTYWVAAQVDKTVGGVRP